MTKLNKFLCTVFVLISSIHAVRASTTVAATISSNQVWTAANSPYIIGYNVLISQGVSVKVMPGTTIQSTGNYRIIVDGEFTADGTYDSVIIMDKIAFEFSKKAVGYDFTANTGSHFNYCMITGTYMGVYRTILLDNVSMLVSNCKFIDCYYTIYASNSTYDTTKIRLYKCIFESRNGNLGYPCNVYGNNTFLEVESCLMKNIYGIFVPHHTEITMTTIQNWAGYSGFRTPNASKFAPADLTLKCNIFRNFKNSVLEFFSPDSFTKVDIEDNTFDSSDNFIIFNYYNQSSCKPIVKNNNFLYHKNYTFKFYGGTAGQPDNFDLRDNYWGTTDTTVIAAGIYDYRDDVTVSPRADFSNFYSSMVSSCLDPVAVKHLERTIFSIFPNPASSRFELTFRNGGDKTVRIFNILGATVLSSKTEENIISIDVSSLLNGVYFVEVKGQNERASIQKLVINK